MEFLTQLNGDLQHDKALAKAWATRLLETPDDWVILDTETTDLDGFIVELAVLQPNGQPALETLLNPYHPIQPHTEKLHGITQDMVENSPIFANIEDQLRQAIHGKRVIVYNVQFDYQRLFNELVRMVMAKRGFHYPAPVMGDIEHVAFNETIAFAQLWLSHCKWECAMAYNSVRSEIWIDEEKRYKRLRLDGGHRAMGDCRATLKVIQELANL